MEKQQNNKKKNSKKIKPDSGLFFPQYLRGKELLDQDCSEKVKYQLERYLSTEDFKYLVKAVKINNHFLPGGKNVKNPSDLVDDNTVDTCTVVSRSINYLKFLCLLKDPKPENPITFEAVKDPVVEKAKNLLIRIGPVFIPDRNGSKVLHSDDFIAHKLFYGKGGKYRYLYQEPYEFVRAFEDAQIELKKTKSKNKVDGFDGYKEAINNLKQRFSHDPVFKHYKITIEEYDAEDLEDMNIGLIVGKFFRIIHINNCDYCYHNKKLEKDLTPEHIQSLYREARDEIYLTELMLSGKATLDDLNRLKDKWKRSKKGSNLEHKIDEAIDILNKKI